MTLPILLVILGSIMCLFAGLYADDTVALALGTFGLLWSAGVMLWSGRSR